MSVSQSVIQLISRQTVVNRKVSAQVTRMELITAHKSAASQIFMWL